MSQYDKLDCLIVEAVKAGKTIFNDIYFAKGMRPELGRLSRETGADADRVLARRLQALRKRGLIEHVKGWGWRVKEAA